MSWVGRYDFATRPPMGQNFFCSLRCQSVTSLRAEKPHTRNKFSTSRYVFTLLVCWATGSSGYNHYLPTAAQYYFECGEDVWFCSESCGRQEVGAIFSTMCQHRFNLFWWLFSHLVDYLKWSKRSKRHWSKQLYSVTDNRSLCSAGLWVALSRLAQSVSVTLMRGNAIMLIARCAEMWASCKQGSLFYVSWTSIEWVSASQLQTK